MNYFQRIPKLAAAALHLLLIGTMNAQTPQPTGDALNARQQRLVTIAAFTTTGDQPALRTALQQGLDAGLAVSEINETLVHLYAYTGFPRSLNALTTFMELLDQRKQNGVNDPAGPVASEVPITSSRLQQGTEIQTRLVGRPVAGPLYTFAPVVDRFLKEHLFFDLFSRDILDFRTRELVTITALATLGNVEAQLRSHLNVGLYNGLTPAQLASIVSIIATQVDAAKGRAAEVVLAGVTGTPSPGGTGASDNAPVDLPGPFAKGQLVVNGNFTGRVWLNMMTDAEAGNDTQMGHVTFAPGARSFWHMHPGGQLLLVTGGTGYVQERGQPKRTVRAGETVACPPGVIHWHGATPDSALSHIAISTELHKGPVVWMEPVSDEQYGQ